MDTIEGPVAALESPLRRAPMPVTLASAGVGRYGRDVGATVHVCALEALNDVGRCTSASNAGVERAERDGMLDVRGVDDGVGGGTTVAGRVPFSQRGRT